MLLAPRTPGLDLGQHRLSISPLGEFMIRDPVMGAVRSVMLGDVVEHLRPVRHASLAKVHRAETTPKEVRHPTSFDILLEVLIRKTRILREMVNFLEVFFEVILAREDVIHWLITLLLGAPIDRRML